MDLRRRYFVNNPDTNNDIEVLMETVLGQSQPLFSVIMPVYNQRDIIRRNVQAVLDNTSGSEFELIIILDACSDDTEDQIRGLDLDRSLLVRVLVLKSRVPMFETACDNLGFFCARGRYLIEVQADIEITERGYNQRLLAPMLTVPAMIGISGRCCHCWAPTSEADFIGVVAKRIILSHNELTNVLQTAQDEMSHVPRNAFFIGETANRGPLMFDAVKLRQVGYLDERNFFLEDSDHDLFKRAYIQRGFLCGYVPIGFNSPVADGSTRKPRDAINQQVWTQKRAQYERKQGFLFRAPNPPKRAIRPYLTDKGAGV